MFLVFQHIRCEGLGTIESAFSRRGINYRYIRLFDGEAIPEGLDGYTGVIILGGPMNVYEEDEYPYLRDEDLLIKKAIENDMPVLGICLGAQLIAKATGARVYKGKKKEIGWYDMRLTEGGRNDRIFKHFPEKMTVFQWHGDTFEIPPQADYLATSSLFPHQAFRIKNNIYALQFHLEVTEEMISRWVEEYEDELSSLDYIDPDEILRDTPVYINSLSNLAEKFFDNFLG